MLPPQPQQPQQDGGGGSEPVDTSESSLAPRPPGHEMEIQLRPQPAASQANGTNVHAPTGSSDATGASALMDIPPIVCKSLQGAAGMIFGAGIVFQLQPRELGGKAELASQGLGARMPLAWQNMLLPS